MKSLLKFFKLLPLKYIISYFIIGVIFSVVFVLEYFSPLIQKNLIDTAIRDKNIFNDSLFHLIYLYILYAIFVFTATLSISFLRIKVGKLFYSVFLKKIFSLKKTAIQKKGTGYYYDILSKDKESAVALISLSFFSLLFSIIQTCFILVMIWKWSRILFIIFMIVLFSSIIITSILALFNRNNYLNMRKNGTTLANETIDAISNNFSIQNFLSSSIFQNLLTKKYAFFEKYMRRYIYIATSPQIIVSIIKTVAFVFTIVYSLNLVISGEMTYGILLAIISYFQMILKPIENFHSVMNNIAESEVSIKRLLNLINPKTNQLNYQDKVIPLNSINNLTFKDVYFEYGNSKKQKHYLDFKIEDEKVGIVGISGEGKTTLLKLLYLEEVAKEGNIFLDDTILGNLPISYFQAIFNIYPQNLEIFNKDLLFNLTLGKKVIPNSTVDRYLKDYQNRLQLFFDYLEKELQNSNISNSKKFIKIQKYLEKDDFLKEILGVIDVYVESYHIYEINFDTYIKYLDFIVNNWSHFAISLIEIGFNKNFIVEEKLQKVIKDLNLEKLEGRDFGENGQNISGGEKQKVGFARFLLKNSSSFFVLDEPFTNLDALTENEMIKIAKEQLQGKKGLIISHNFTLINNLSDSIIVIHEGKIAQKGTHQDLIEEDGIYSTLYNSQKKSKK
ncbi:MAG: hypothetical protein CR982_07595 [Candidatus Cloacimonadota bacterium]|nr:MAG: hypothetical protein CR982_07595 [Candidatus Cloacimonadota bacterium]